MSAIGASRSPVGELVFEIAGMEAEPALRRLTREQALPGWVTLGFEREPDFFLAGAVEGDDHHTMIAREVGTGRIVAMHTRSVREVYLEGEVRRLGYLGQLRLDPALPVGRWQYRLMRDGFAAGRRLLRGDGELPYDFTSIIDDERGARRFLEAGLAGLPRYVPITGMNTYVIATSQSSRRGARGAVRRAGAGDLPRIAMLLERGNARLQLAPVWSVESLGSTGRCRDLLPEDFLLHERDGELTGCVAVWDQRGFKQTVVHGYRAPIAAARPLYNWLAPLHRYPRLPPAGETLAQAWSSHLAVADDDESVLLDLLSAALEAAARRGLDGVLIGLSDRHFARPIVERAFRALRYRSTLYLVHWPDEGGDLPDTTARTVHVEGATL